MANEPMDWVDAASVNREGFESVARQLGQNMAFVTNTAVDANSAMANLRHALEASMPSGSITVTPNTGSYSAGTHGTTSFTITETASGRSLVWDDFTFLPRPPKFSDVAEAQRWLDEYGQ
jgi:hypothetical protein